MAGHGEKLRHKQEQAIAALVTASSLADAALQAGIGERTLLRWLKEAVFQTAYREARRQIVHQAIAQVQQATGTAVATLVTIMQTADAPASAKVSAAKAVLETAIKAVELEDLEGRIAALEAHQGARP